MSPELERAMYEIDYDRLAELAPCKCCCLEHAYMNCPAHVWTGCITQRHLSDEGELEEWVSFYERVHGMSREIFFGGTT